MAPPTEKCAEAQKFTAATGGGRATCPPLPPAREQVGWAHLSKKSCRKCGQVDIHFFPLLFDEGNRAVSQRWVILDLLYYTSSTFRRTFRNPHNINRFPTTQLWKKMSLPFDILFRKKSHLHCGNLLNIQSSSAQQITYIIKFKGGGTLPESSCN